ncbi:GMC oxidoreductase [Phytohabitans sp. ZYX-F-186]|uniref:Cholesterol oxidase n=1 Tax=Phytohabitans maris TaxID=3071409 RepID=A0ABU0ZAK3_9ACTN|nr:GMC oxidoreductase [Phytohabitans sp. ZYX-F-186]MDQ7904064.1 GMC oxidoreductase [Phytohabitans sp. ZYX-F-186]
MAGTVDLSRRELLGFAAAAAVGAVAGPPAFPRKGSAAGRPVPTVEERHRVVIIGSGYGGAVAAHRLAAAGVPNVVLERGRRWPVTAAGDTFPPFLRPDRRSSWFTPAPVYPGMPPAVYRPYAGLFEKIYGRGMNVICGAGVGGLSLVDGVMLQPAEALFARVMPAEVDYREMADRFYPLVRAAIGVGTIPDDVLAHERYAGTRLFLDQARRAGLPAGRLDEACDWDVVRAELAGRAVPSASIGEYLTGVNSGARTSVDRNYLARAEATGRTSVRPLHVVTGVSIDPRGRYVVRADRIDADGVLLERFALTTDAVFFAAGSMGTSRLLVRARDTGALPALNEHVGRHWGNNGLRLYLRALVPEPTGARQGGPTSVAIMKWDDPDPVTIEFGPAPFPVETHAMPLPGIGLCAPVGRFEYRPATDDVELTWSADGDRGAREAIATTLRQLVTATGWPPLPPLPLPPALDDPLLSLAAAAPYGLLDMNGLESYTFHPLGGAVLGRACDGHGRLAGYRGLYVVDSALIPGSTGACNPALTVAALAERCLADIVARDAGTVF